jgi:bifunctional DNA-binding transcriptional regulator/antitoxin component of YhaV-PrlF toxin-antitoxin module
MEQGEYITIRSEGRLTLPVSFRKALKLSSRRKVRVSITDDGLIALRLLPDATSFFGSLGGRVPFDPNEKKQARSAMGRRGKI